MYLWSISGGASVLLGVAIAVSVCVLVMCLIPLIIVAVEPNEYVDQQHENLARRYLKKFIIILIILMTCSILLPSKKDLALIYVIPKIANQERMEDFDEIYKFGIDYIKKELTEVKKGK